MSGASTAVAYMDELRLAPTGGETGILVPFAARPSADDVPETEVARLIERFENLTWQIAVPIAALVVTLAAGVLVFGQFLTYTL